MKQFKWWYLKFWTEAGNMQYIAWTVLLSLIKISLYEKKPIHEIQIAGSCIHKQKKQKLWLLIKKTSLYLNLSLFSLGWKVWWPCPLFHGTAHWGREDTEVWGDTRGGGGSACFPQTTHGQYNMISLPIGKYIFLLLGRSKVKVCFKTTSWSLIRI